MTTDQTDGYTDYTLPPLDTIYQEVGGLQLDANIPQDVGGIVGGIVQEVIPGSQVVGALLGALGHIIPDVVQAVEDVPWQHIVGTFKQAGNLSQHFASVLEVDETNAWGYITKFFPTTYIYREMLSLGLGVDYAEIEKEDGGTSALDVIDRMLAFAFAMPLLTSAINLLGKIPLAGRWAETALEGIGELPEEMGLTWAMGMQIDRAFETALGTVIEEGINKQKRGQRIAWPQLRTMFKQHVIKDKATLHELLARQGFPDEQITWLMELGDMMLPVGDLQQMYLANIITNEEMKDYIGQLGFRPNDVDRLYELYVNKAQTGSGALLRQTARSLFRDQLITEDQYRAYFAETNSPERELDMDVEAINVEHTYGRLRTSATVLKAQYLHGKIDGPAAVKQLMLNGYTHDNASDTVASWDLPPISRVHGLSQSRILSYFISGVLTKDQAYEKLQATNLRPDDIDILLAHPRAQTGVVQHRRSPSLVVSAYLDGAIDISQLDSTLRTAGVADEDVYYWHTIASYRKAHQKGSSTAHVGLDKAEILRAYKLGMFDPVTAQTDLEQLGYTSDDALTLLTIEMKGIPPSDIMSRKPGANLTIAEATTYLTAAGYTIHPPPDPLIAEYESFLWSQGWTVTPPLGGTGDVRSGPIGGTNDPGPIVPK